MESKTFQIPSMVSEDVQTITYEIEQIDGVKEVHVHKPTLSVTVTWAQPATWDKIERRLLQLHFTPDLPQEF